MSATNLRHADTRLFPLCTIGYFYSSLKRNRLDRPFASCGGKRYLRRTQLAALLKPGHSDEAGIVSPIFTAGICKALRENCSS